MSPRCESYLLTSKRTEGHNFVSIKAELHIGFLKDQRAAFCRAIGLSLGPCYPLVKTNVFKLPLKTMIVSTQTMCKGHLNKVKFGFHILLVDKCTNKDKSIIYRIAGWLTVINLKQEDTKNIYI